MLHLPLLRQGRPYRSVETARVLHHRTREPLAEVSQANPGLIRRDLRPAEQERMAGALRELGCPALVEACERAAAHFATGELPLGDASQGPEDYVRQTSASTGLPQALVRRNLEKVRGVLSGMRSVLAGLTRGIELELLDRGHGRAGDVALAYAPRGATLGVVLPSNSPGVHALWPPAIALRTALVLRPGSAEPWTPYRLVQALIAAGVPPQAFGYYPSDHAAGGEVLRHSGRGMVFGDVASTRRWLSDPRIEVHGPGYSKVLIGPDVDGREHLDVIAASIAENSGRSCINASGVWTCGEADALAEALAERLAVIEPRDAEDPAAELAPFADPRVARAISAQVDAGLAAGGAVEVTARYRSGPRLREFQGCTYLLPTVVRCAADHPLANREFLFPFASVVAVSPGELPDALGPTLALMALTRDEALLGRLLRSTLVHRLNLGPLPSTRVAWDQPHEGNLFEHLWQRRALQAAPW